MSTTTSATVYGISYSAGKTFKARISTTGKAASDGSGSSSTITAGNTYCFVKYNSGAAYPYAIGTGSSTTVRCWVKATVFPYATYTVAYNANGGSGAPSSQTKTYGTTLTLSSTKPTRTGYTFKGWATSSGSTTIAYSPGGSYTANAAITLYAVWSVNTYTVTYNANGGSGAPSSQTKTYGVTLTLSSTKPTRTGYTFKGWGTSSSTTTVSYAAGGSYTSNASITLYAIWSINTYTVSYNANGGSGAPSSQTKTYGVTLTLSTTKPTRTGYTFKGWSTSSSATSATYAAGGSYTANASATLYAVWSINTYTIYYDAATNGGSGSTSVTKSYGSTLGTLPTATRQYYNFVGWFTAAEGGTQVTSTTTVTKAAVYYAQYVIDASVYVHNGSEFVQGFPYVYTDGEWVKGYAYVHDGSTYQQGVG